MVETLMDESDMEEQYEKEILEKFTKLIDRFQKKTKMENTSMIKLLTNQIERFVDKITLNISIK